MIEKLKVGLRISALLPVLVLLLLIVMAVGIPALIGHLILMGVYVLSKNTIHKFPPAVQTNIFFELFCLLIFMPTLAIGHLFYVPLVIACIPLIIYFYIAEYLAGRWLEKHVFAPQNS
ncbi:MAG: hypothetical protein A2Y82_00430 [Candidatus Buchananbacteria bacterium RBG_13_36_9]|uniref:Uncharacterized protein n=1 Tax=Candidatus Buchananbacteria bacterium RBG_13_36_9 TaxID=1797530 RepID=A0A1G1XQ82_9BACT|nr:MAG: hypothetical protein A2Y82_00430 [Candidatus Buchananbacteria bacterium RBG_13_36_9]